MGKEVSGTKEWASSNVNVMTGCSNDCLYCYAKEQAIRFDRRTADTWKDEELREGAAEKGFGPRKGTIMFPTTHDITSQNVEVCEHVLGKMLKAGNRVLVVSKPRPEVIQRLCFYLDERAYGAGGTFDPRAQVLFRFTIGTLDPSTARFWEPGAPAPAERLFALMWAFKNDWKTSVSMEPLLDESPLGISLAIRTFESYVTDAIWLGKMNNVKKRLVTNGHWDDEEVRLRADALMASQRDGNIRSLYDTWKGHPKVKWKESIKKIVGLDVPTEAGLDV